MFRRQGFYTAYSALQLHLGAGGASPPPSLLCIASFPARRFFRRIHYVILVLTTSFLLSPLSFSFSLSLFSDLHFFGASLQILSSLIGSPIARSGMPLGLFTSLSSDKRSSHCLSATMPSKRRPTSLLGPTITRRLDCGDHQSSLPFPPLPLSDPSRFRTQSLQSGIGDQVFVFSNSSKSSVIPPAQPHANMTKIRHEEVPSYISSRSANSLISFSRPTRIQAATLHYLNKVLDELLLHVLTSAKSLATDRIKTDGILKVLGGQSGSGSGAGALLAKNAVLEAELELRNYLDDQRKEGGKVPLGLSATSRWDGTESFPIQKAYEAVSVLFC